MNQNEKDKQTTADISVVILAYNEEIHIRRCLENVAFWVQNVFVVDCFSTDRTIEIANQYGALVFQNKWEGLYARQFNWALDNLPIKTKWVLRLDADEYLCPELVEEIKIKTEILPEEVTGVLLNLRRVFMGRVIRRGMPKIKLLRLFRFRKARCEQRMMDEHMELLEGRAIEFEGEFADHNLNNLSWWTQKHIGYALREAADLLDIEFELFAKGEQGTLGEQAAIKRKKKNIYARMPLFWRSVGYFCKRYFVKGGFLEGKEGFLWHFLQGLWYRTLVDAKILEIKAKAKKEKMDKDEMRGSILRILREEYGMKV